MTEYAIRDTETTQHGEHGHAHSEMTSCRVSSQYEPVNIEPELLLCTCYNPNVGLITIVDRIRIGIFRR